MKNKKNIIIMVLTMLFFLLLFLVFKKNILYIDKLFYDLCMKFYSNNMTVIFKFITNFGGILYIFVILIILLLVIRNKKINIALISNLGLVVLLNQVIKFIVKRPRPQILPLVEERGYSFPSGHSMISLAFYGFLIYLIYNNIKNKKYKYALMISLSILIVLIGISRVYLGVHYLSDVLAGVIVSIIYLLIFIESFSKVVKNEK